MNALRKLAKDNNQIHFDLGKPCKNGHISVRFVSNGRCVECRSEEAKSSTVRESQKRYYERVKTKRIAQSTKWKNANPIKRLGYRIKKYGLTVEQYEAMLIEQHRCCAICKQQLDMQKHTHVDHCHNSLKVRGILCSKCNSALGYLRNSVEIAVNAAEYLRRFL